MDPNENFLKDLKIGTTSEPKSSQTRPNYIVPNWFIVNQK